MGASLIGMTVSTPREPRRFFLAVKAKPSMMIWSMLVQCKGVEDQAAIKETVESLHRRGYPELIVRSDNEPAMLAFRDAVIRELKQRCGVRAIAHAPPKYDSASAGMVENATKHVKEKVRTLVTATRDLHGVVMDPEHVALAWCVRFAGQINARIVKGADGLTAFQRERAFHPQAMRSAWGEKILYLEASKKKIQITDKFLEAIFLGTKEVLLIVWYAELSKDGLVKTLQILSFSTSSVEHPGDGCQLTSHEKPESQESNRCELMYVPCMLIYLLQSARSQRSHAACTFNTQLSWLDTGTLLDASAVKQPWNQASYVACTFETHLSWLHIRCAPGCIGCEAAMEPGKPRRVYIRNSVELA